MDDKEKKEDWQNIYGPLIFMFVMAGIAITAIYLIGGIVK